MNVKEVNKITNNIKKLRLVFKTVLNIITIVYLDNLCVGSFKFNKK